MSERRWIHAINLTLTEFNTLRPEVYCTVHPVYQHVGVDKGTAIYFLVHTLG